MKDEIKEMIDCISYMSEEERKRQLELSDIYEFGTAYAYYLLEENKKLKEIVENLTTMTVCGDKKQIKNTAQYKLEKAQSKIDKANEAISSILYSYDERMYEYCDVNYIEELRKLKKELGDE